MKVDAFVLVGGRSSRLGEDKAAVIVGRESLAERAVRTTTDALPDARVRLVAAGEDMLNPALMSGLPFVFDLYPGRGAVGGVHGALAHAETDWAFVLACDFPFVSVEFVRALSTYISDEIETVVPVQVDGRIQPLCGFYKVRPWIERLEEVIVRPRVPPPLFEFCKDAKSRFLTYPEYSELPNSQNFFLNINTREDLVAAVDLEHKLSSEKVI
jgi:molybdopterin-guanine dinucleotide biosynthesis protein A